MQRQQTRINPVMLNNTIRELWQEHILWTRLFIISSVSELADLELVTERLLRNPQDFGKVLRIFYGKDIVDKFVNLFTDHLLIAADLVNYAKAGDNQGAEKARKEWFANADEIAAFLASINPHWSQSEWRRMLYDHLEKTEMEAVFRLTQRYAEDIANYENIESMAMMMADEMTNGIIKQFLF